MKVFKRHNLCLSFAGDFAEKTMVFQHGLGGNSSQPTEVFPEGTGYQCVALECRGHGASDIGPHGDLTICTFAADLISFVERHADVPIVLGGISMGAAIALRVAVERPDLIKALVLARPAWLLSSAPANMLPYSIVGNLLERDPASARNEFRRTEVFQSLEKLGPDNLNSLLGFCDGPAPHDTAAILRKISVDGPGVTLAEVQNIKVPTLAIGHDQDFAHPIDFAVALSSMIPTAKMVQITAKAADPEAYRASFKSSIADFLKEIDR